MRSGNGSGETRFPGAEDCEFDKGADGNHKWCIGRAAEHGQKAAMRWLIEFVGVARGKKTKEPCRPAEFDPDTDVSIQSFVSDGSDLEIPIDKSNRRSKSWVLADVWKGCSQSCVHATDHTNHPSADPPELSEAFMIVVEHLQAALYTRRMEVRLSEIVQKMH